MPRQNFAKIFNNKSILITGGTGSIGSEIVRQLTQYNPRHIRIYSRDDSKQYALQQELQMLGRKKRNIRYLIGDVRDRERLDLAIQGVDIVFHAAALKHVQYCEYNPFETIKTNINGMQNVIDFSLKHKVERVIAISTDKAVYPDTIMGITKLMMERMMISSFNYMGKADIKFAVVRFGNVIGSRGSVIPTWIDQIQHGGPVTVTDKHMIRYFMSIPDAVNLVFSATKMTKGREIFVLKHMQKKNIYDLAQETIKKHANGKKIKIKITGIREREKIDEKLYTDEETETMVETKDFYIVLPEKKLLDERKRYYKRVG